MLKVISQLSLFNIFGQSVTYVLITYLLHNDFNNEIAYFALLTTFLSILTPFCSLRFETAYLVSGDDFRIELFLLSSLLVTIFIYFPFFYFLSSNFEIMNFVGDFNYFFLNLIVVQNVIILFFQSDLNKSGKFKLLSYTYLMQPVLQIFSAFALLKLDIANFLVISFTISQLLVIIFLYFKEFRCLNLYIKCVEVKNVFIKFWKFPIISSPSALLNGYQQSLPILFLTVNFHPKYVAIFYLLNKIIAAPAGVISNAAYNNIIYDLKKINSTSVIIYFFNFLFVILLFSIVAVFIVLLTPMSYINYLLDTSSLSKISICLFVFSIFIRTAASSISAVIPLSGYIQYEFYWKSLSLLITYLFLEFFLSDVTFDTFIIYFSLIDITLYFSYALLSFSSAGKLK